ncbi:uncharacterized protein LOC131686536 [Topomyia yanbarensis]|uniref:uncharacterized protein LOC131686536 n=1 Tax=Topomyia yanbarensis TaxID=2498891 RepID=UPI00273B3B88|nr:uncharacterized protein LOC131686536 [Topomyia yanbarensis]XP_058826539.1 uncharacterized protein LOC131686536 [Topomyia yanbarensis]
MEPVRCKEPAACHRNDKTKKKKKKEPADTTGRSARDVSTSNKTHVTIADSCSTTVETTVPSANEACVVRTSIRTLDQVRKFFAPSGSEYVKKKVPTSNRTSKLNFSACLTQEAMDIKLYNQGCLLLINDGLLAKVTIKQPELLDQTCDFEQAKKVLLNQIQIVDMYFDDLARERTRLQAELVKILRDIGINSAENSEFARDCITMRRIGGYDDCGSISYERVCKDIVNNGVFSVRLTRIASSQYEVESAYKRRAELLPCFAAQLETDSSDLIRVVKQIRSTAATIHKGCLLEKTPEYLYQLMVEMCPERTMFISSSDVEFFRKMSGNLQADVFREPIQNLSIRFIRKVNVIQIDNLIGEMPLTNSIFLLLCRSLEELINEISAKSDLKPSKLIRFDATRWKPAKKLARHIKDFSTKTLGREYYFVFKLLTHFDPASSNGRQLFEYKAKLLSCHFLADPRQIMQESYVWFCMLDDALSYSATQNQINVYGSVIKKYTALVGEAKQDQLETVRILSHCMIRFIAHTITIDCSEQKQGTNAAIDSQILQKQLCQLIPEVTLNTTAINRFRDLINVFNAFWNHRRDIITTIPSKNCHSDMCQIPKALLDILLVALDKKVKAAELLDFCQSFNKFLIALNALSFDWFIRDIPNVDLSKILVLQLIEEINNVRLDLKIPKTYRVSDPVKFVQIMQILYSNIPVPKHYVILIVKAYLSLVLQQLNRKQWSHKHDLSESDQIASAGTLLSGLRNMLPSMKHQPNFYSFDNFFTIKVDPVTCAVSNSISLRDFNSRVLEAEFDMAVDEYFKLNENCNNKRTLLSAFQLYSDKFQQYMSSEGSTDQIVQELRLRSEQLHFQSWNWCFKQKRLPIILAGLAALWFTSIYYDGGKTRKLHVVQILCLLNLLEVDDSNAGVAKHFAQVLPGQGKTLMLGLTAALLALTGHSVCIVCRNADLAASDRADFQSFLELLDIRECVSYRSVDEFQTKVTLKMNGQRVFRTGFASTSKEYPTIAVRLLTGSLEDSVLLIDDVDLFDELNCCKPSMAVILPGLDKIQTRIWDLTSKKIHTAVIESHIYKYIQSSGFEEKYRWQIFLTRPDEFELLQFDSWFSDSISHTNKTFFGEHLKSMIKGAYQVCTSTGASDYTPLFDYLKREELNATLVTEDNINYGYLIIPLSSNEQFLTLVKEFPLVLGLFGRSFHASETATIEKFADIRKWSKIPFTHQLDKNINESGWMNRIADRVHAVLESKPSVLVIFSELCYLTMFQSDRGKQFSRLNILMQSTTDANKHEMLRKVATTGTVTLALRETVNVSEVVKEVSGIHVIQMWFAKDPDEELQIKRQAAKEDYELIICSNYCSLDWQPQHVVYDSLSEAKTKWCERSFTAALKTLQNSKIDKWEDCAQSLLENVRFDSQ